MRLGTSWSARSRGRAAKQAAIPPVIGIDEKAIAKGHRYMTLVCDLEQCNVEYIGDERRETSLRAYFEAFAPEARDAVRAISLDMWPAYINALPCRSCWRRREDGVRPLPYHAARAAGCGHGEKAREQALVDAGDNTLIKSKYLWLHSAENVPDKSRERFDALKDANVKTARAWALKESLRDLWECPHKLEAGEFWKR